MSDANVKLINRDVEFQGYSFMYPKGSLIRVVKWVRDPKTGASAYHALYHHPVLKTCHEVQFDTVTGEHHQYKAADEFSCYNIKLDVSLFSELQ